MACRSVNVYNPLSRRISSAGFPVYSKPFTLASYRRQELGSIGLIRGNIVCSAIQESSSTATADKKEEEAKAETEAPEKAVASKAPAEEPAALKPKKAPAKPLPEMMEEEIIPPLRAALEAEKDITEIELSFQDNRLEGYFLKNGIPYCFWAFFPNGDLTGPKGFSISAYGSKASTVEPFLIDERKITAKQVVFWVRKRLAAQGIIPIWND